MKLHMMVIAAAAAISRAFRAGKSVDPKSLTAVATAYRGWVVPTIRPHTALRLRNQRQRRRDARRTGRFPR